jgi:hypothetical protein
VRCLHLHFARQQPETSRLTPLTTGSPENSFEKADHDSKQLRTTILPQVKRRIRCALTAARTKCGTHPNGTKLPMDSRLVSPQSFEGEKTE